MQSARDKFRRRESVLQEEEELALFRTIAGVADQVNREAIESEFIRGIAGASTVCGGLRTGGNGTVW